MFRMLFQLDLVTKIHVYDASFGVSKGFPYAKYMNHQLLKMKEQGALGHFFYRHQVQWPECKVPPGVNAEEKDWNGLTLKKVIFLFLVVWAGFLFALLIFVAEKYMKK